MRETLHVGAFSTCMRQPDKHVKKGERCVVDKDSDGLFVPCRLGGHHLDGQDDGDGHLVGFYPLQAA